MAKERQRRRQSLASRGGGKKSGELQTRDAEGVEFEAPKASRIETPKPSWVRNGEGVFVFPSPADSGVWGSDRNKLP